MVVKGEIRTGVYFDSVTLMIVGRDITAATGVLDAAVVMGTGENQAILKSAGLWLRQFDAASDTDLLLAVKAANAETAAGALRAAGEQLKTVRNRTAATDEWRPLSLEGALRILPGANVALISVTGRYAGEQAMQALKAGLNVMLFSDNVPLAQVPRCPWLPSCPWQPSCQWLPSCPWQPSCQWLPRCPWLPSCPWQPSCQWLPRCPWLPSCPWQPSCQWRPSCPWKPSCHWQPRLSMENQRNFFHWLILVFWTRHFTGLYKYHVMAAITKTGQCHVHMGCLHYSLEKWERIGIRKSNLSEYPDDGSDAWRSGWLRLSSPKPLRCG